MNSLDEILLNVAVQEVVDAWTVPGPVPEYHEKIKHAVRQAWPTLAEAIEKLRETYDDCAG